MVNFTREPIVETVITPREGHKLVVRNSKATGLEEYFVDAVEIVSFGQALFYRSLERPKNFLLPVADYEVLEVRETRMVLKHVATQEKKAAPQQPRKEKEKEEESAEAKPKRRQRRRRSREEEPAVAEAKEKAAPSLPKKEKEVAPPPAPSISSLLPPPSSLISESIDRYKDMLETEPNPVPPPAQEEAEQPSSSSGGFSATRFLRRLTGRDEGNEGK